MLHKVLDKKDIDLAESLLDAFSKDYIHLYGESSQTFTFHGISNHLVENVRLHGSLQSHSMFSIESTICRLKSTLNGTRGLSNQYLLSKILFNSISLTLFL